MGTPGDSWCWSVLRRRSVSLLFTQDALLADAARCRCFHWRGEQLGPDMVHGGLEAVVVKARVWGAGGGRGWGRGEGVKKGPKQLRSIAILLRAFKCSDRRRHRSRARPVIGGLLLTSLFRHRSLHEKKKGRLARRTPSSAGPATRKPPARSLTAPTSHADLGTCDTRDPSRRRPYRAPHEDTRPACDSIANNCHSALPNTCQSGAHRTLGHATPLELRMPRTSTSVCPTTPTRVGSRSSHRKHMHRGHIPSSSGSRFTLRERGGEVDTEPPHIATRRGRSREQTAQCRKMQISPLPGHATGGGGGGGMAAWAPPPDPATHHHPNQKNFLRKKRNY